MTDNMNIPSVIKDLENRNGHDYSEREKVYALTLVNTDNQSEAARQAGSSHQRAGQTGSEMAKDPRIQELVEAIKSYSTDVITDDFIKAGILKEALEADNSRDRREALHLLGKTKGLFRDVIDQRITDKPDTDLVEDIRRELGEEAGERARKELGLD